MNDDENTRIWQKNTTGKPEKGLPVVFFRERNLECIISMATWINLLMHSFVFTGDIRIDKDFIHICLVQRFLNNWPY